MNIFQLVGVACIGTVFAILIKNYRPELAIGVSIASGLILLFMSVRGMEQVFSDFQDIIDKSGVDIKYFATVVKVIAIAYITEFAAEICRDGGQNSIALKLELAGKVFVMAFTMPIIKGFLELVVRILS
ncbi:MAG: stage III sporulation protein AD [Clostridia bacterium]|nr:stage III sporulation protein AD [Clostridia bacterium]